MSQINRPALAVTLLCATALMASACTDDTTSSSPPASSTSTSRQSTAPPDAVPVIDPGDGGVYEPVIDPATFTTTIDNPYYSLAPGSRWVYEGEAADGPERIEVVVTDEKKVVDGVTTVVVRDTVTVDGAVVEDTYDWYAQDAQGNVWYFGEDVKDYENGVVSSTAGSWEAGVDGAVPGIVMPAAPAVGDVYRQEFLAGEAEDMFEITAVDGSLTVPFGAVDRVVTTKDWTPLEADVVEEKQYASGVGKVREEKVTGGFGWVELVSFEPGS